MERRTFIGTVVAGIGSTAGCVGASASQSEPQDQTGSVNPISYSGTYDEGDEFVREFGLPDGAGSARADVSVDVQRLDDDGIAGATVTVTNTETGDVIVEDPEGATPAYKPGALRTVRGVAVGDVWGDTLEVRVSIERGENIDLVVGYSATAVSQ